MYSPLLAGQILERIATEFNQLQFHAVQSKGMPLLDKVRPVSSNRSINQAVDQPLATQSVSLFVWNVSPVIIWKRWSLSAQFFREVLSWVYR